MKDSQFKFEELRSKFECKGVFCFQLIFLTLFLFTGFTSNKELALKQPNDLFQKRPQVLLVLYGMIGRAFDVNNRFVPGSWSAVLGLDADVDVFYSVPRTLADVGPLRNILTSSREMNRLNLLLSLLGSRSVKTVLCRADLTQAAAVLVQRAGHPFLCERSNYITHRSWSTMLGISASIALISNSGAHYDLAVLGRLDAINSTFLNGTSCLDAVSLGHIPALRVEIPDSIEDRFLAFPPRIIKAFGEVIGHPEILFNTTAGIDFNENLIREALIIASTGENRETLFVDTCVDNFWAIPGNFQKYSSTAIAEAKSTWDAVTQFNPQDPLCCQTLLSQSKSPLGKC